MANVLGAARLSRKTDESTSIERQREQITYRCKERGDNLVWITEDSDVSGAISPFSREGLGPWLTDPNKIDQWDILIIPKIDRLTRSLKHFDEIVEWCERNGKTIISLSESLDLSTSTGRMFANILAMFAQFERERIGERRKEAGVKMRENGWWQGGQAPYGWMPVKVESHWELRESPEQVGIIERMARELIGGKSRRGIGRDLTADGIPTPTGRGSWGERTITVILKNETVLDDKTRASVRKVLDETKTTWNKRGETPLYLNVAFCTCGKPLYSRRWVNNSSGKVYEYYRCADKCIDSRDIPMTELDETINEYMEYLLGPVFRKTTIRGKSVNSELKDLERKIDSLDKDADDYLAQVTELDSERKRLKKAGAVADKTEYEEIHWSVGEYWKTLTTAQRRELLVSSGIKAMNVTLPRGGQVHAEIHAEQDSYYVEA